MDSFFNNATTLLTYLPVCCRSAAGLPGSLDVVWAYITSQATPVRKDRGRTGVHFRETGNG
jgi:hypothetical protein